jgi:hypothetical protein
MSLRGKGLKGQQRRHALFTDVTDDVMLSAVRGERRRLPGTIPEEGASARECARFWASLLPRLSRRRLESAAYKHLMAQLVAVVPPPTKRELAAADRSGAARAAKHVTWKAQCRRRRARS